MMTELMNQATRQPLRSLKGINRAMAEPLITCRPQDICDGSHCCQRRRRDHPQIWPERALLRHRIRHSISFEACLPRKAKEPPNGPGSIHEIKHDGFRILARKDGNRVKLITRNGYDFADRYRLIVDGIASLPVETCIIDGEAIVVDQNGLSIFDLLRYRQHDHAATLFAFDLLELDGAALR